MDGEIIFRFSDKKFAPYCVTIKKSCIFTSSIRNCSPIHKVMEEIKIGTRFQKQINKGKMVDCVVIDIIKRVSTVTGAIVGKEYWATSDSQELAFEVSKTTIIRGRFETKG